FVPASFLNYKIYEFFFTDFQDLKSSLAPVPVSLRWPIVLYGCIRVVYCFFKSPTASFTPIS
ncbi:hypothetical protein P9D39_21885, partial [Heyndrickxia oleronia]|uniref:hypothetical protein n=1 Tax=Heyndrickxia oleronia TaxID=38875 RepID=UPI002DBD5D23